MNSDAEKCGLPKILDALHRLHAVRDAAEFPGVLMAVTSDLVPCANMSFDTVDLATGAVTNVFSRPISISHAEFLSRWQVFCHQHPGISFLAKGGNATVFEISDFVTQREFRRSALYHEVFKPCDGGYQIGVILPVPGFVVGMAINREIAFTAAERQFIELLHPHFVQAFQNAQLFSSLRGQDSPPDFTAWRRHGFTRRECDVLRWLLDGKRNGEIATILGISRFTVKKHVEHVFARFGVETRAAAAAAARRLLGAG